MTEHPVYTPTEKKLVKDVLKRMEDEAWSAEIRQFLEGMAEEFGVADTPADRLVAALFTDLSGRRGFRQHFDRGAIEFLGDEVLDEIRADWKKILVGSYAVKP